MEPQRKPLLGFIGQGFVGKNYADEFGKRGYSVVRYALEEPYQAYKSEIAKCDVVFIAVPTPTTPSGFDASIVREVLPLVGEGNIAVIKSTLVPGTTLALQGEFPDKILLHSPEFLSRSTAKEDTMHPYQNIVGMPEDTERHRNAARRVLDILPKAPNSVVSSNTSELFKYVHNTSLFVKSVFMNLLYDVAQAFEVRWEDIQQEIVQDPMLASRIENISHWHITPVHTGGRGIGGDCHIKDFEAFARLFQEHVNDPHGNAIIDALKRKNISLLKESGKDLNLLHGVYGDSI